MKFQKVLVSVNGGQADREAVQLACNIAKGSKSKVYVVYIIQVKHILPLDAEVRPEVQRGEEVLDHAQGIAQEQDCEVETELLQARDVGAAIIYEAMERRINIIVMGMNYKMRFGQFSMGNVIPYVLKNSPCPVVLFREPIS
jgi:nucleotide-binding universal stress UspA family protein